MQRRRYGWLVLALIWMLAVNVSRAAQESQQPVPVTEVPGASRTPAPGVPTQPAVAGTTVPSPAAPQNPMDQLSWAFAASLLIRYVSEKKWFAFLTPEASARAKTVVGFVTAFCTAAGIHLIVNGSFLQVGGATVTVSGLSFDGLCPGSTR